MLESRRKEKSISARQSSLAKTYQACAQALACSPSCLAPSYAHIEAEQLYNMIETNDGRLSHYYVTYKCSVSPKLTKAARPWYGDNRLLTEIRHYA